MSTQEVGKYRQFFDVDEKYFPCIDDSAIEGKRQNLRLG